MRIARLLLFACLIVSLAVPIHAAAVTQSGTMNVSAVVFGPPPADPPTVDEPQNGHTYDEKNILMRGGCIAGLAVKVFENGDFVGSTVCDDSGQFELHIDLVSGKNELVTKQYDSNNQPSPSSQTVIVHYLPPQTPATPDPEPTPSSAAPTTPSVETPATGSSELKLSIDYDYAIQTVFTDQPLRLPIQFTGGTPSYAVSVAWGDEGSTLASRQDATRFDAEHSYREAGTYIVKIQVTDRDGHEAHIELVVLVSGQAPPVVNTILGTIYVQELLRWPTVAFAGLGVFGIGIGVGALLLPPFKINLFRFLKK
jgi:hypothetical protein